MSKDEGCTAAKCLRTWMLIPGSVRHADTGTVECHRSLGWEPCNGIHPRSQILPEFISKVIKQSPLPFPSHWNRHPGCSASDSAKASPFSLSTQQPLQEFGLKDEGQSQAKTEGNTKKWFHFLRDIMPQNAKQNCCCFNTEDFCSGKHFENYLINWKMAQ